MKISGKIIFITGAAKRVGRAIALDLASRGADLIIHFHRSLREAKNLQAQIEKSWGMRVDLIRGDLGKVSELKKIAQRAWQIRGRVDVLINNASTFYPTPLGKVRESEWEDLFNVNARAPFFLSEAIGLKMKRRGEGKIINIADWAALHPYSRYIPYCASKAALVAVGQGMARALAPEVQVNTVMPGPVLWPEGLAEKAKKAILKNTPLQRAGTPEHVAAAVRFFIEAGDFSTGSLLHVDGGRHIA